MQHQRFRQCGFTLIELSIVVLLVGLLLSAIMMPIATQYRIRETRRAQQQIEEVRQALIGFAQSRRRLPCPDTNRDGLEDYTPPAPGVIASCDRPVGTTPYIGNLPYATIGLSATDPWGRLFAYRVAPEFINRPAPGVPCVGTGFGDGQLGLCDNGNIVIFARGDDPGMVGVQSKSINRYAATAAAVIVSFGPNGYCGMRTDGTQVPPSTGSCPAGGAATTDEFENSDMDDRTFVSRPYTSGSADCADNMEGSVFCEFDDLVVWISTSLLLSKLIEAGQLP